MIEGKLRPIATAPRDGRYVIVAGPSGYTTPHRYGVAKYMPEENAWVTHSGDWFTDGGCPPTLWHPLLEVPSPTDSVYEAHPDDLPDWEDAAQAVANGRDTPLTRFVYNHEPAAGARAADFRIQLTGLINYIKRAVK